jgi:hypothetical protein
MQTPTRPGEGNRTNQGSPFLSFCKILPILCLLRLFAAILLLAFVNTARAQFTWTTNADNTITITGYTGSGGDVTIPTNITGLTVSSIGSNAFSHCQSLTTVTIPDTVTNIGDAAFGFCFSLSSVTIGDGVTSVGDEAFVSSFSLTNVTIGNNVSTIGAYAFESSSLASVNVPGSVSNIGTGAFFLCYNLTNVVIGCNVASIGDYVFKSSMLLAGIYFTGNAPSFGFDDFYYVEDLKDFTSTGTIIYYLTGTTGWGGSYAGTLEVPWNPLIQTSDGSFGARNGQFGFNIADPGDIPIAVEASATLSNPSWSLVATMTVTNGSVYFSEPVQTNAPARFYRIGSP